MAIVQVASTNPHFSFLIRKNPSSGMMLRSIRKGMAYGWYSDDQTYNIYFKDADNEVSYKQHEQESFEYLNVSRYNTSLFVLNAITEFCSSPLKARDERDLDGYVHSFFINLIHIERPWYIDFFRKHLKDFTFDMEQQAHKSYSLKVTTAKSLYHLFHAVGVLSLFLAMFGHEHLDLSDNVLDKYIRSVNVIDAPFYIRSLFAKNFLTNRELFETYRTELEKTDRYAIRLAYGSTGMQRRSYIGSVLRFDKSILDVGCGEGFYAIPFAGKIEGSYYAVDIDEEQLAKVRKKAAANKLDNIITYASLDQFLQTYNGEPVDVILTEVIEHMSREEAMELVRRILKEVQFDRFILTTPNADFNPYYELTDFRHEDHKWEMGETAFRQWMQDVVRDLDVDIEYVAIGDEVNEIRTTQGAILKRKGA